jgi:DNA-binding response OmpR family regulator
VSKSIQVLIVEDNRPSQVGLAALLGRMPGFHEPLVAGSVAEALDYFTPDIVPPDVVILDLMLPDISGFDVCRRLRSDRATMLTPIVMLTALGDATNRIQGFRVGANAYVTKPYAIQDLIDAIAAARAWRAGIDRGKLQGEIHVELDSEVTLLQDVNDFLLSLCRTTPLADEQVLHLRQAAMEMAQNAIEWGNRHRSDRLVTMTYRVYDDRVEIVIRDQGAGFDRHNIPHAAIPDDPFSHLDVRDKLGIRSGGFGLLICEGMVDELQYNDVGNEVTLIKRFRSAKNGCAG